jgi:translation initiation factor IF-2
MMSAPAKSVFRSKSPRKSNPSVDAKAAIKGTLHKPAAGTGARQASQTGAAGALVLRHHPVVGKEVKSAKLSSSWAGDPAKKKAIPTRGAAGAPVPGAGAPPTGVLRPAANVAAMTGIAKSASPSGTG